MLEQLANEQPCHRWTRVDLDGDRAHEHHDVCVSCGATCKRDPDGTLVAYTHPAYVHSGAR